MAGLCGGAVTFALHALAEEALQQALAELADGGTGVGVDGEGVGHFDPAQHHLLHPDGTATQQRVPLCGAQQGALGERGGGVKTPVRDQEATHLQNVIQQIFSTRDNEPQRAFKSRGKNRDKFYCINDIKTKYKTLKTCQGHSYKYNNQ